MVSCTLRSFSASFSCSVWAKKNFFIFIDLPNRSAWGSKRANFYHTDFVDKDHGRFQGSDAEEAEEEEREAKELQAKLTRELTDDDFGLAEAMESLVIFLHQL